jgi:hypothetical protein
LLGPERSASLGDERHDRHARDGHAHGALFVHLVADDQRLTARPAGPCGQAADEWNARPAGVHGVEERHRGEGERIDQKRDE